MITSLHILEYGNLLRLGSTAALNHIIIHNAMCCYSDSGQENDFLRQLLILLLKLHSVTTQAHTCASLTGHRTRGCNTPGNSYITMMSVCLRMLQNTRFPKHARRLIMQRIPSGRLVSVSGRRHQHRGSVIKKLLLRAEALTNAHMHRHTHPPMRRHRIEKGKPRTNSLVIVPFADVAATAHATYSLLYSVKVRYYIK